MVLRLAVGSYANSRRSEDRNEAVGSRNCKQRDGYNSLSNENEVFSEEEGQQVPTEWKRLRWEEAMPISDQATRAPLLTKQFVAEVARL